MTRLILTFDDSAAGALKKAGLADCVVPLGLCFVWGRLRPANELNGLLSPRAAGLQAQTSIGSIISAALSLRKRGSRALA
jgi:hypothetical protein